MTKDETPARVKIWLPARGEAWHVLKKESGGLNRYVVTPSNPSPIISPIFNSTEDVLNKSILYKRSGNRNSLCFLTEALVTVPRVHIHAIVNIRIGRLHSRNTFSFLGLASPRVIRAKY